MVVVVQPDSLLLPGIQDRHLFFNLRRKKSGFFTTQFFKNSTHPRPPFLQKINLTKKILQKSQKKRSHFNSYGLIQAFPDENIMNLHRATGGYQGWHTNIPTLIPNILGF